MGGNENGAQQSLKTAAALARLDERLKGLETSLTTAHGRIDKVQDLVREGI
ncbi:hypothetical protein LCGC14_0626070 [marine sediment metagenome]|uniref:Uncharacterized protein n=1 Tax=marine sediment metagenome TaxID=412755 RepID=A0A0F9RMS0_9ZZZZ